jgi:hypothetical protein
MPTSRAQSMRTLNLICVVGGSAYFSRCPLECSGVSTPEEKCIGFPERKYISEAGKKGR